jgi:hypothetical protein
LLRTVVDAKRIVAILFHGERKGSRGVGSSPDVADMTVSVDSGSAYFGLSHGVRHGCFLPRTRTA